MRKSASLKGGPRRRRLSVFQGNERGTRGEEEMEGGGNSTKWGGGGWEDNDDYNGEYRCRHPPYSYSSRIESDAVENVMRHPEEVSKRWQRVGRSVE